MINQLTASGRAMIISCPAMLNGPVIINTTCAQSQPSHVGDGGDEDGYSAAGKRMSFLCETAFIDRPASQTRP